MIVLTAIFPVVLAFVAMAIRPHFVRGMMAVIGTALQLVLVVMLWIHPPETPHPLWFRLDDAALLVLSLIALVFFMVLLYTIGYINRRTKANEQIQRPLSQRICIPAILFMEAGLTLCCITPHFGIFAGGLGLSVLSAAPLIYYRRSDRAAAATWKFLLVSSLAMALLMIGGLLNSIAVSASIPLSIHAFFENSGLIDVAWFNWATVFYLVGFSTLMAIAPMHAWLPETEEATPSPFAPLLSCGLALAAFLGFFRIYMVAAKIGSIEFLAPVLIILGFVSVYTAAFFIVVQASYKRLLSCLAIGQFGILMFGLGLGVPMLSSVFLHLISYTLIMTMLFFLSGNINAATGTYQITETADLYRRIPRTAVLWVVGTLAICGFPLFGLFITEFNLLRHCIENGSYIVAAFFMVGRFFIFAAITYHVLRMIQPAENGTNPPPIPEPGISIAVPLILGVMAMLFGIYVPSPIRHLIDGIVTVFSGGGLQ